MDIFKFTGLLEMAKFVEYHSKCLKKGLDKTFALYNYLRRDISGLSIEMLTVDLSWVKIERLKLFGLHLK